MWQPPCVPAATKPVAVAPTAYTALDSSRPSRPPLLPPVQFRRSPDHHMAANVRPLLICLPTTT